ncbi:hypothetical protein ACFWMG_39480 [Streptomyces sp. NPDC127074]|uniref:hypothetical protein n=1 Tax=Streptomyces sp. NPDC127074 TaxID=3347130 RepID=UPI003656BA36
MLSRQVRSAGLLRHRPLRSVTALAVTLLLLTGGWAPFLLIGDSWWQLTVAAVLAFAFTQCGFRGHEAGHRQLFHGKRANDATCMWPRSGRCAGAGRVLPLLSRSRHWLCSCT